MKLQKTLWSLLFLLMGVSFAKAQTQITDVSQLATNKYYTIKNSRTGWAAVTTRTNWKDAGMWTWVDLGYQTYNVNTGASSSYTPTNNSYWCFKERGSSRYLYNYGLSKYINKDGSLSDTPRDPILIQEGTGTYVDKFVLYFDTSHFLNAGGNAQRAIDGWGPGGTVTGGTDDAGNANIITEVGTIDEALYTVTYNYTHDGTSLHSDTYSL